MSFGDDDDLDDGVVSLDAARKKKRAKKKGSGGPGGGDGDAPRPYPEIRDCPVKPLGMVGDRYAFLTPTGAERYLSPRELQSSGFLSALFDGSTSWLREHFPSEKPTGFIASGAMNYLVRECVKLGFFVPEDDLRGAGAWRMSDNSLLLHLGSKVLVYRERGSLDEFEAGKRYGKHIYPAGPAQAFPAETPASADDAKDLLDAYATWNWEHTQAPLILLGFIGCSFIPGALRHRPHAWVTGDTSTGKTTLERLNRRLMGNAAIGSADATKMGIAFRLAGAAKSIWLDEMERDVDSSKQDGLVELARIASSDDQQGIVRGQPGGFSRSWRIRSCIYMSSILPAPLKPMDKTRIHVMDLRPLPPASALAQREFTARLARLETLGPALLARTIRGFWRFQANERVVESAMIDLWQRGGRIVDQLGTLIAMAFTLLSDQVASEAAVKSVLSAFAPEDIVGRADEGEAPKCIAHLMTSNITYEVDRGRETRAINELITAVYFMTDGKGRIDNSGAHKVLKRHGVAFVEGDTGYGIVVAHDHQGLTPLYAQTRWHSGVWSAVLKRLPGAYPLKNPTRFNGAQRHGTFIPLPSLGLAFDQVETGELKDDVPDEPQNSPVPPDSGRDG